MESIFFEKQDGMLCAQHALNMLLQQQLFSAVDLAEIANQLDRAEQGVMEGASRPAKSENMDDSGFFSVQVISKALEPFTLDLVHIDHPSAKMFRDDPTVANGFICNQQQHWFALRKLGQQWFELNSMKKGPQLLSDTYLSIYLHQLRAEGYTIFLINGVLPDCEADRIISACPVIPEPAVRKGGEKQKKEVSMGEGRVLGYKTEEVAMSAEERDIAAAIALSMGQTPSAAGSGAPQSVETDADLRAAIEMSLQQTAGTSSGTVNSVPVVAEVSSATSHLDDIRNKREEFLRRLK